MNIYDTKKKEKVAIVLGGTVPHKILVRNLKDRGYKTILIDYNKNPPASSEADIHIQESALNPDAVEKAAKKYGADLILSAALDQPLPVAVAASEKLGLPTPFDSKVAYNLTNKSAMKEILQNNGITTPAWCSLEKAEDLNFCSVSLPLIIKPEDGTGSRGISIIEEKHSLTEAYNAALSTSNTGKVILEQFIKGIEVSVDCIVINGKCETLLLRERHKCDENGVPNGVQCVATISPANVSETIRKKIEKTMDKTAIAFGIKNSVLHVQLIVSQDECIYILEVAGRVSGGPGGFVAVKKKTSVDMLDSTINFYLGKQKKITIGDDGRHYATGSIYCAGGVLGSFIGVDDLISKNLIEDFYLYKSPGDHIPSGFSTSNRVAGYAISAESREALRKKIFSLFQVVDILNDKGQSIFLRSVGVHQCL
ncbi:MAG: ATP-grasp domain-containing protein [Halomonadaceae bacterium]|jgi:biotin carboxylase